MHRVAGESREEPGGGAPFVGLLRHIRLLPTTFGISECEPVGASRLGEIVFPRSPPTGEARGPSSDADASPDPVRVRLGVEQHRLVFGDAAPIRVGEMDSGALCFEWFAREVVLGVEQAPAI